MRPSVLILDDDPSFLRACDSSLSARYNVIAARSVEEASTVFQLQKFAAVIVAYWLGAETAEGFLDLMKQSEMGAPRATTPCIIVSASADKELATKLLNRQVFGLLEKPVQFEKLIETVDRAIGPITFAPPLTNASPQPRDGVVRLKVNLDRRTVVCDEISCKLTPSELKILTLLIEALGKTVNRDVFIRALWGRVNISRSALDTHILNLKKKLPQVEPHLHAIYGAGYLLDAKFIEIL